MPVTQPALSAFTSVDAVSGRAYRGLDCAGLTARLIKEQSATLSKRLKMYRNGPLMKMIKLLTMALICALPISASAAELAINSGLWETTMTRTDPMTGQPVTETNTECVTETKFDPSSMLEGTDGCQLVEEDLSGETLTFKMECNMQGAQAFIDGTFQTDGQTGQGNMDMTVNANGMNMSMNMNWKANRLGDC